MKTLLIAAGVLVGLAVVLWAAMREPSASLDASGAIVAGGEPAEAVDRGSAQPPAAGSHGYVSDLILDRNVNTAQLVRGFFAHERDDWRWTRPVFAVVLATPEGASAKGGVVRLQVGASASMLQKGPIRITAKCDDLVLGSATLGEPRRSRFDFPIPASLLSTPTVRVQFQADKTFRVPHDQRELGLIVSRVTLLSR